MGAYHTGYNISKKAREYVLSRDAHMITHLCCHYLKKDPARRYERISGKKMILGVRSGESIIRKRMYNSCFNKKKTVFTPLWDLTEELENKIYKKYNIEIPKIYSKVCRTGCMGCPYGSFKGDTQKELELIDGTQKEFICEYFKESYKVLGI
jgi:3'-phosphoadenosine 5'-phosphosulfate sulfotransferase (PAPS reductase)/FAD synthetase